MTKAKITHCPDEHGLLHNAGTQQMHHSETEKCLDGEMYYLTTNKQTHTHFAGNMSVFGINSVSFYSCCVGKENKHCSIFIFFKNKSINKATDFNNFWQTTSQGNLTLEIYKLAHLDCCCTTFRSAKTDFSTTFNSDFD